MPTFSLLVWALSFQSVSLNSILEVDAMIYELWDTEGRNLVASFDTETEALQVVRDAVDRHGLDALTTVALVQEDERGESETLAIGAALVERAQAAAHVSALTS